MRSKPENLKKKLDFKTLFLFLNLKFLALGINFLFKNNISKNEFYPQRMSRKEEID